MAFSHLSDVGLRRISSDEESAEKRTRANSCARYSKSSAFPFCIIVGDSDTTYLFHRSAHGHRQSITDVNAAAAVLSARHRSGATVLLRQIIPRLLVQHETEKKLLFLLPAIRPIYAFVSFFVEPISTRKRQRSRQKLEATIAPDAPEEKDEDNDEDFQALMEVGEAEGIIEEEEREMIETIVEFATHLPAK